MTSFCGATGADIKGYDTRQSALDLKELRESLGISRWNVYGVSYGTRYALDLMRVDPEGTACVVLDSPMTTSDPNNTTDINLNMQRVFNLMFDDCAAQSACNAAYPNLRQKFSAAADYIKQYPIVLQVKDPVTGVMTPLQQVERRLDPTDRQYHRFGEVWPIWALPRIEKVYKHVTGQTFNDVSRAGFVFRQQGPLDIR